MQTQKGLHRAWIVLVATLMIQAGATGVIVNCTGVLFSAVLKDLGFRAGDLSLFYTIRTLSSSLVMAYTVKLFFQKNSKVVMGVLGTMVCASFAAMAFFNSLWQWYVAAVFAGIGGSCAMVAIPIVLNNWFRKSNGLAIGLTMAGSGVAGAVFSPILSKIIVSSGWRQGALTMAGVAFVLIVPASLLLLVSSPEKVGWTPYGAGTLADKAETGEKAVKAQPQGYIFALCLLCAVSTMSVVQFAHQVPTFANTVGYTIETGAILTSCCMVGNLAGKLLYGALIDRVGVYTSARTYLVVVGASLGGFLFLRGNLTALYASAVLYGACYAVSTMTPSLLFLDLYGQEAYKGKLSRLQAINGVLSSVLSAAIPYMYDATGSFDIVFVVGLAGLGVGILLYTYLCSYSKKRQAA